tara:strand:- start:54 stop:521 length:468 start_codon:yes stop_codon:yes gene_type:complete
MVELDAFDIKMLVQLQHDARTTSERLAELLGLSPTACQRRLKRLRASGVISAEIAVIDPAATGNWITLIAHASLVRGRPEIVDAFKKDVRRTPEIQQCFYVTGDYAFVMVVVVQDIRAYDQLIRKLFMENPNILKFQTSMVIDTVKTGLSLPFQS